jgi:hypothetical protein
VFTNWPSENDLKFLTAELARFGVPFPEPLVRIARGYNSLCLIGEKFILKLLRITPQKIEQQRFYDSSLKAYTWLSNAAAEIAGKQVGFPSLTAHGVLQEPICITNETYWGWQQMPLLPGKP